MRRLRFAASIGAFATVALMTSIAQAQPSAQEAANMRVFREVVQMWESGDTAKLNDVVAPDYIGHPAAGDRDLAGLRARIAAFREQFRGAKFAIKDQVASGDKVATRLTATATSKSGKPVRLYGMNISRFRDGRIVEEWPVWEVEP